VRGAAFISFCALVSMGAGAQATETETESPAVLCKVEGYDVVISNTGEEILPEGLGVTWSVPFARAEGTHVLSRDLEPGHIAMITGALGSSYLGTRTVCIASLESSEP
jgi:hypothetical protein